ncbi:sodium-dependent phosphate transporter 1-A-like [Paramacrobiotus metropolitanus]|uniref:sodium-dependent phosphate transporter 1-A-like n=1 Tax=Paramacrobiotus metropolitanus TaxID=2943436 RepID=UPI00244614AE|nr:sodium-dependent phosphate transporter 1-A-like [Paramacrobiotus metropolitanus]
MSTTAVSELVEVAVSTPWSNIRAFSQEGEIIWMVVVGFLIAFVLAFAVGANDVANSFGTSVGSKVLTLRQACIMAVIFESLGAVLIGYKVSDTIWKDIADLREYRGSEKTLMLGEIAALVSAAIWLLIATFMKIPVSGTHSIVGATMGFSLVKRGVGGIHWIKLGKIVASWFISPFLAGAVSAGFFLLIRRYILLKEDHLTPALHAMPLFYGLAIFVNCLSIFLDGPTLLYFDRIPWWGALIICTTLSILTGLGVWFFVVPWQKKKILERTIQLQQELNGVAMGTGTDDLPQSTFASMNPSRASSVFDMRPVGKKQRRDFSTGTPGGFLGKIYRRQTMSASTSMTGLAGFGGVSRTASQAVLPKTAEEPSLPSVAEHHDEHDAGIFLDVPVMNTTAAPEGGGARSNGSVRNDLSVNSTVTVAVEGPREPLLKEREAGEVRISPELSSGPGYGGVETPVGSEPVGPPGSATPKGKKLFFFPRKSQSGSAEGTDQKCFPAPGGRRRTQSFHRVKDPPEVHAIFSFLQILTAGFTAFAHGGNDVCNAIGPLIALWVLYSTGSIPETGSSSTPFWLLLFGGFGISVGLSVLGRKVIETVGTNLTPVIPSSGFCIGLGTACTVLVASKIGLPISTTHCIVGSVVSVGWLRSSSQVNFRLFRTIIFGWFVTLPVTVGVSAAAMAILSILD